MGKTILSPIQQLLLDKIADNKIITRDFYLTGGTALSEFYLRHRLSADFAYFPFPVLGKYEKFKMLRIASIEDIAVNKLQAILTRSRGRDYYDIYEIVKQNKSTIEQMRKGYRLKFEVHIPDEQLARRLAAVLEAKDQPKFLKTVEWESVKQFFLLEVKKLQPNIIV